MFVARYGEQDIPLHMCKCLVLDRLKILIRFKTQLYVHWDRV